MCNLIDGLRLRNSMQQFNKAIEAASDEKIIEFTTEIYRQTIHRTAILADLEYGTANGLNVTDVLETQIYPLRLRDMSPESLRSEATKQYERYLIEEQAAKEKAQEFFEPRGEAWCVYGE